MKLVIKFPTRNRPEKFKHHLTKYIEFLSGKHNVRFVITCDEDDPTMNNEATKCWFAEIQKENDIKVVYGQSKSKVEACNADLEGETGDVLLLASDDMLPVVNHYDESIYGAFQQVFPEYDGAVKFADGLRSDQLMTLPCLGWKLYKAFGYVYHPDYTSLYCDNEQTQSCFMLNRLAESKHCIIQHRWVPGNHELADKLHQRNEDSEMYAKDEKVFERRKIKDFDVDVVRQRLITSGNE